MLRVPTGRERKRAGLYMIKTYFNMYEILRNNKIYSMFKKYVIKKNGQKARHDIAHI